MSWDQPCCQPHTPIHCQTTGISPVHWGTATATSSNSKETNDEIENTISHLNTSLEESIAARAAVEKERDEALALVKTRDATIAKFVQKLKEQSNAAKDELQISLSGLQASLDESNAANAAANEKHKMEVEFYGHPLIEQIDNKIISDDQKRIATPKKAIDLGADFLVIGRPITESKNPLKVLKEINKSLS